MLDIMSRKNFNVNIVDILGRISSYIGKKKNIDIAKSLGVASQTCSNWKERNAIPWEVLFRFAQNNNVSLDWLLTGKSLNSSDPMSTWPEDVRDACLKAKEIIELKDPVITPVLMSNIAAFYDAIKKKEDNQALAKKVDDLQKEVRYIRKISKPDSRTGTD